MKPEKDPLFSDNSGSVANNNDVENDHGDGCHGDEEATETAKLLRPPPSPELGPREETADIPMKGKSSGDDDVPLISLRRPMIERANSALEEEKNREKKGGGGRTRHISGTLNVLAAQTLKIASINGLGEIDKLENDLEDEIRYENRSPAKTTIGRIRRTGHHKIHSKAILLIVVLLNIIDCCIVISEILLEFLQVLLDREEARNMVYEFIDKMAELHGMEGWEKKYENSSHGTDPEYISYHFLEYVLQAFVTFDADVSSASMQSRAEECAYFLNQTAVIANQSVASFVSATVSQLDSNWSGLATIAHGACFGPYLSADSSDDHNSSTSSAYGSSSYGDVHHDDDHGYSSEDSLYKLKNHGYEGHTLLDIAHKLHYASVAILAILILLLLVKIFCSGKRFFRSRMAVFDGIVVIISFILDIVFIEGFTGYGVTEFVIIIIIILPWRILRILNSLVAAVLDQQRLNLKIIYTQKKKISRTLSETNTKMEVMQRHIEVLQSLCTSRGLSVVNGEIVGTRKSHKSNGKDHGHSKDKSHGSHGTGLAGMMALGKLAFQAADALAPLSNNFGKTNSNSNNNNDTNSSGGKPDGDPAMSGSNGHATKVSFSLDEEKGDNEVPRDPEDGTECSNHVTTAAPVDSGGVVARVSVADETAEKRESQQKEPEASDSTESKHASGDVAPARSSVSARKEDGAPATPSARAGDPKVETKVTTADPDSVKVTINEDPTVPPVTSSGKPLEQHEQSSSPPSASSSVPSQTAATTTPTTAETSTETAAEPTTTTNAAASPSQNIPDATVSPHSDAEKVNESDVVSKL